MALRASAMVSVIEMERSGGLPRERSETSCVESDNLTAIHRLNIRE